VTRFRTEHDLLGSLDVPAASYYGIHTLRAVENFRVTGSTIAQHDELVGALAAVKQAAAVANTELGLLAPEVGTAIVAACGEIRGGALLEEFVVDPIQGGAGTSTNMNVNEVVANRALELLGREKGDYAHLSPLEHVNLGQSTNDVYPTALRIALVSAGSGLHASLRHLRGAFEAKARELDTVVKVGRTQLQDAVPMTLGQELSSYAVMLGEDELRLEEAMRLLHEVNLGGTAIGTGLNAAPGFGERARAVLAELTGLPLVRAAHLVEATQDCGALVTFSGVLKRIAVKLSKTCNDLRLLSSGPRSGFGDLVLPARQAGSSIMPGKVNPVIPEMVNQVAFEVIGNDLTVTMAAEAGQLQLNAFEPVIAHVLLSGTRHLSRAARTLADLCVAGISADAALLRAQVERSIGTATLLSPALGYAAATGLANEALLSGRTVAELVLERDLMPADQLARLLSPEAMTGSG
jgi:aspartate ammonia-lyase